MFDSTRHRNRRSLEGWASCSLTVDREPELAAPPCGRTPSDSIPRTAGYAEALGVPVIYAASKQSVVSPGTETRIHFDIHKSINWFTNHEELKEKIHRAFDKNKQKLLAERPETSAVEPAP